MGIVTKSNSRGAGGGSETRQGKRGGASGGRGSTKPDSVRFGELAIAGGLAGFPVAVCFLESDADLDCELWKYFSEFALGFTLMHIDSPFDVGRLNREADRWRVVVLHTRRGAIRRFSRVGRDRRDDRDSRFLVLWLAMLVDCGFQNRADGRAFKVEGEIGIGHSPMKEH